MIIACTSCPAQYVVPDARVLGKKVRLTCKHCGAGIIIDATAEVRAPQAPLEPLLVPRGPAPGAPALPDDDLTVIARPKARAVFSVHEEPTVIGQIPREALEFERRFAQRTLPPPADDASLEQPPAESAIVNGEAPPIDAPPLPESSRSRDLWPQVPLAAVDETKRASPRAFAVQTSQLRPGEAHGANGTLSAEVNPTAPVQASLAPPAHSRWRTTLLVALVLAAMVALFVRQRLH